jgi:integrase
VAINPTTGVDLPAVRGSRDRIAAPSEAAELIAALPRQDRALWATAMYAGLRRGELMALRWAAVDLAAGVIRVDRSLDRVAGEVEPKSAKGKRKVPIVSVLHDYLTEHKLDAGDDPQGYVFAKANGRPFDPSTIRRRALKAWEALALDQIGLHECRHTYASLMIAAGVNAKALCTFMGHSSIVITMDRYGGLFPGSEEEAAGLLDDYLGASLTVEHEKAREAAVVA